MDFCLLLCEKNKIFSVLFPQQLNDRGSIGMAMIGTNEMMSTVILVVFR